MTSSVPAVQQAQKAAELKLAAISDVDAFSAFGLSSIFGYGLIDGVPALSDLLQGNIDTLLADDTNAGYAGLSALDVFFGDGFNAEGGVFTGGGIDALANYDALSALPVFSAIANAATPEDAIAALAGYDALSAIPPYIALAGGDISATGDLASLSAVDTFVGDGPIGQDGNPIGPVFGSGGIDALAPDADGNGGYAALSALPVFAGTNENGPFGLGVFTGGGIGALKNYDALSAIPAYLNATQGTSSTPPTPFIAKAAPEVTAAPEDQTTFKTQAVDTSAKPLAAIAPADPAPADPPPASTPPVEKKENKQNDVRNGLSFKPEGLGTPLFLTGGGAGVDNSIRGYGDAVNKVRAGLGLGPDTSGGAAAGGGEGGTG
ncbi:MULTISPECIES: hypothetical protein [unclassified Mycobacterium]|uniref:hypothetical protein n=1 Tax=unclassified Mycobacterium TaxID=2642494 RepID=UPI0029C6CB48|nr:MULTISPECIES: hypothetical protein [unclassified Mycobacterium]